MCGVGWPSSASNVPDRYMVPQLLHQCRKMIGFTCYYVEKRACINFPCPKWRLKSGSCFPPNVCVSIQKDNTRLRFADISCSPRCLFDCNVVNSFDKSAKQAVMLSNAITVRVCLRHWPYVHTCGH